MTKRITIICGAYGSGKTEFSLAYAARLKEINPQSNVALVDLDIVNPYFRSRDVTAKYGELGLEVVSSKPGMEYSDLPALSPRIYGLLQDPSYQVVFDVGGDPAGARALGRFNSYLLPGEYELWIVINPYRPDTKDVTAAVALIRGIETTSRLRATGLVSNINLGRETTGEVWSDGLAFIAEVAQATQLPIRYHAVSQQFAAAHPELEAGYPLFPMHLLMLTPWNQEE